jgi:hypothetical protein
MMYKYVTKALENCYIDHHLEAAFHSQLKRGTQLTGESLEEFTPPLTRWLNMLTVNYPNT